MVKTLFILTSVWLANGLPIFGQNSSEYHPALRKIKTLYSSATRFDEQLVVAETTHFNDLSKHLETMSAETLVESIDFEEPFEAFYILGYCFQTQRGYRKPVTTETRSKLYGAFFNRCVQDQSFRKGIVRYFAWTKSLYTDFRYQIDLQYGLSFFHKYCKGDILPEDEDASEKAFFSLMYMELFGFDFANKLTSFEDEIHDGFTQLNECRINLVDSVHESHFEVHHGYLYKPSAIMKSDRTIRISSEKDPKKFTERIPNSIAPLFPTERFSIELQNFLDLHEINRLFCWKI